MKKKYYIISAIILAVIVILIIFINLKNENEELKRENLKLKNYIERTFEVVKNLFNFPIGRFKRLVNNFVEYFEK